MEIVKVVHPCGKLVQECQTVISIWVFSSCVKLWEKSTNRQVFEALYYKVMLEHACGGARDRQALLEAQQPNESFIAYVDVCETAMIS